MCRFVRQVARLLIVGYAASIAAAASTAAAHWAWHAATETISLHGHPHEARRGEGHGHDHAPVIDHVLAAAEEREDDAPHDDAFPVERTLNPHIAPSSGAATAPHPRSASYSSPAPGTPSGRPPAPPAPPPEV